jgi:lipoyl(octanoyl) transferase
MNDAIIASVQNAANSAAAAEVEWRVSPGLVPYGQALAEMEARAEAIRRGDSPELIWLLEHPPVYTAGTSADPAELFNPQGFPVHAAGRGGRYTYHGPGQRVVYVLVDLDGRGRDVRNFVHSLENWVIGTLGELGIVARSIADRIGIWVERDGVEAKIGAIGVRVRRWVTMHGFAVNLSPDLDHFSGIVPCGLSEFPVTSLEALGMADAHSRFDQALEGRLGRFLQSLDTASRKA